MKFGTMLSDMLPSVWRPLATIRYPKERQAPPIRLRGKLTWNPEACIGCGLCEKDCPSQALELIVIDKAEKRFAMRYHIDRCTFCAQCVFSCRQSCLQLDPDSWELAATSPERFVIYFGEPENVRAAMAVPSAERSKQGQAT